MDVSSDTLIADPRSVYSDTESKSLDKDAVSSGTSSDIDTSDIEPDLEVLTMDWLDAEIESQISNQPWQLQVDRVEYLSHIPTYWPVPHQRTAYTVDLRDPEFDVFNHNGELLSADMLIKNKVHPNTTHCPILLIYFHRTRIHGQG